MGWVERVRDLQSEPRRIEPWLHEPVDGIPYYDEELDLAQGHPHKTTVMEVGSILSDIASQAGLTALSDESIWYLEPRTNAQKNYFCDLAFSRTDQVDRVTAEDLVAVIEVVTTTERRKEYKDTVTQKKLNEYNRVPEFGLIFPEEKDERALIWHRYVRDGGYVETVIAPGNSVQVSGIPGLEIRVKPRHEWSPGRKLDIYYQGQQYLTSGKEHQRAEAAEQRAETAEQRVEVAEQRAETAEQRVEVAEQRVEAEKERAETAELQVKAEKERAEAEKERAEAEKERADQLAAKLRAIGINPESLR